MKNRILSILLILSFIISMPVTLAENTPLPKGERAYEILTQLNLLDKETDKFKSGEKVERAELVRLVNKVCGILTIDGKSVFADVDEKSEDNKYILAACEKGLIHGDESGYFYPYEIATQGQLLKIAITALGYEYLANVKGGWPNGYYRVAERTKLTDGLQLDMNAELTYDFAMVMLLNLAESDILEAVGFSGDETEMVTTEGRNILSTVHDIYILEEAVVEATPYTHLLAADSMVHRGRVVAGGKEFLDNTNNAIDLIGQTTKLYYRETAEATATLLYIETDDRHNKLLKVKPSSVLKGDFDTFRYLDEKERIKTVSLSDTVTPLLNGKLTTFTDSLFEFEIGEITLIDNNNDKKYDVVNIMSYENHIVSGVNKADGIVAMKDGDRITLDNQANEYDVIFIKKGKRTDINAVEKGNVLSVAQSDMTKGLGLKTVHISDETIDGTVTAVMEDSVLIDEEELDAREEFLSSVSAGKEGRFLLDAFGYVCYIEEALDIVYGFLKHMYKDDNEDVWCRIFTENGNWVELKLREKVRYNYETKLKDKVYELIGGENKESYRQLIRYLVNNEGLITTLQTAKSVPLGSADEEEAVEENIFRMAYNGNLYYRNHVTSFNGTFIIDENTKIFDIPEDIRADEDEYRIVGLSELNDDQEYTVSAYDLDEMTYAKAVVTKIKPALITSSSKFMVVYSVKKMLDKDENLVDAIKGYWNGTECTIPVKLATDSVVKDASTLKKGDVIRISFDSDGNIAKAMSYSYSTGYHLTGSIYSINTVVAGEVKNTDFAKNYILLKYQDTGTSASIRATNTLKVTIYDSQDGKCMPGKVEDIIKGDTILASLHQLVAQELIVIR